MPVSHRAQWRIQDFPDGGRQPLSLGQKPIIFGQIFAENHMKIKEIGASLAPLPDQGDTRDTCLPLLLVQFLLFFMNFVK